MEIKVLGPGGSICPQTENVVRETVDAAGVTADVEKVTDEKEVESALDSFANSNVSQEQT